MFDELTCLGGVVAWDEDGSCSPIDQIEARIGEQLRHDHAAGAHAEPLVQQRRERSVDEVHMPAQHDHGSRRQRVERRWVDGDTEAQQSLSTACEHVE